MLKTIYEKWYDKYIGFPYEHLGTSIETGIDCFNIIKYIYKCELGIEIPYNTSDFCKILDEQWYNKSTDQPFANFNDIKYGWRKVIEPNIYDVITMSIGATNCTNHCALYVDKDRILHTMLDHTSWVSPYGKYYKQYTMGIYRWNLMS